VITNSVASFPDQSFDTSKAADYLGVSASILNKWRVYGQGPDFRKLNRRVVYRRSDLDAWMDTKRRRSTSDN
jgi:predicted site-specific integrase-resolvase